MTDNNPTSSIDEQYYDEFEQEQQIVDQQQQHQQQQHYQQPASSYDTSSAVAPSSGRSTGRQSHQQQHDVTSHSQQQHHPQQQQQAYTTYEQFQPLSASLPSGHAGAAATSGERNTTNATGATQPHLAHSSSSTSIGSQQRQQQQTQHTSSSPPASHRQSAPHLTGGATDNAQLLRPTIPSYLHSSTGSAGQLPHPNPLASLPQPLDPRSTPDYQVAWELELWRRTEVKKQLEKWKYEEAARMRILEEEFAKAMKSEEAKLHLRILKLTQQEKTLQQQQSEIDKIRSTLKSGQTELASRLSSLDKEISKIKGEADSAIARMKDSTTYEVNKVRAQSKDLAQQNELYKREIKSLQSKLNEVREEHERDKLRHAKSNFGMVEAALRKKEDELEAMIKERDVALKERDYEKERLQLAIGKGMMLYKQIETLKAESLEAKQRDADFLRQQYLNKERESGTHRSIIEAHDIRSQVKAHLQAMSGPARVGGGGSGGMNVQDAPVHQPAVMKGQGAAMSASTGAAAHSPSLASIAFPIYSTAQPTFNTFPTPSVPPPQTLGGVTSNYPAPPSSIASRGRSVPEPYQYLVHEQEVMSKVKHEAANQKTMKAR